MRAKDLTRGNIAYHHTLNQDVWDGDELRVDVRYKLLEIAKRFVEYLDVPDFKLVDVILRGSLTNYNYTQYSDFDLHIVTDYAVLDCDITEPFYMAKKKIWNDEHDITIKGHEVELYVEDRDEENASEGMYSVLDNIWHKKPTYNKPDVDDRAVSAKARDLMTQINRAVKQGSVEDISRLQTKIKDMRQSGLDRGGEFSTENLAFKVIRNKGYIDRLYKNKNQKFDQELSLDEGVKSNAALTALIAALSGNPAQADYNYPNTQPDPTVAQKAIGILRTINNMKHYGRAGLEGEAQQELNNLMRSIQGMPNQSHVYPLVKDLIKDPKPIEIPQDQPVQDQPVNESEARLDPAVEEFLDGLTPDDVGYDTVGGYVVHYEGFTDQCQDSEEYQDDPEAVFQEVWSDFKRREGDKDPVNYGIVGEHDYPIVYSVFRR
jgi:hypothetical protein